MDLAVERSLVRLFEADPVLRRQVLERGRPIYVRDARRLTEFRVRSWMEYLDLQPYRERTIRGLAAHLGGKAAHG